MDYSIANQDYQVTVSSKGAELSSLIHQLTQTEFLWQADARYWGRHAPVLFPIVGRLNQDCYRVGSQTYQLSQHGFARDQEFTRVMQAGDRIIFSLQANETTRPLYPFPFGLTVSYELNGATLTVRYQVNNPHSESLPFSIGGHPGFRCPLLPQTQFQDYSLVFSQPETLSRHYLEQGLLNGQTGPMLSNQTHLSLNHELFLEDALVFKFPKSDKVQLVHQEQGPVLSMTFPGFPYLGVWTKPDQGANFICIEPWYGIADQQDFAGELKDKEGVQLLAPQGCFDCAYTIRIYPQALQTNA